jgi:pimeloyl-ACP methyl ester carboxylesterase
MIGNSFKEYVFIRACIFVLHYFAPLLIAALVLTLIIDHNAHRVTLILQILAIAEVAFYVLVYIPKYRSFQAPARHPPLASFEERRKVFNRCFETVVDGDRYLSQWFGDAPMSEIRRENVNEFFSWAFLNKGVWGPSDEEELEEYVNNMEEMLSRPLEPGRGAAVPLRLTIDPVNMLHRPLLWYLIVSLVDAVSYLRMCLYGFKFHRLRLARFFTVFPFRLITLTARNTTPSETISYWHLPHTSKTRRPVLFIHGIGIGLYPYVNFLAEINRSHREADDGQVGIIAIELMPISFRITGEMPNHDRITSDILAILNKHGWDKFVLASHSYGSVVSASILKHQQLGRRVDSMLLSDPVAFLLQLPDVANNFTRRRPRRANEHQLYYFASTDMCVAQTLARHFFWLENILWKEDVDGKNVTVTLSGRDLIVNTLAVGRYLTQDEQPYERFLSEGETGGDGDDTWQERTWKGEGLDVMWFERCDHAQQFDNRRDYRRLVDVVRAYSAQTDT